MQVISFQSETEITGLTSAFSKVNWLQVHTQRFEIKALKRSTLTQSLSNFLRNSLEQSATGLSGCFYHENLQESLENTPLPVILIQFVYVCNSAEYPSNNVWFALSYFALFCSLSLCCRHILSLNIHVFILWSYK